MHKNGGKGSKILKNDDYEFFTQKKYRKKKSTLKRNQKNIEKSSSMSKSSYEQRKLSVTRKKNLASSHKIGDKPVRMRSCTINFNS